MDGEPEVTRVGYYDFLDNDIDGEPEVTRVGAHGFRDDDMDGEPEVTRVGAHGFSDNDIDDQLEIIQLECRNSMGKSKYNQIEDHFDTDIYHLNKKRLFGKKHRKKKEKCEKHLKGAELEQDHLLIKNEPENSKSSQFVADSRKADLLFGETKIDMRDIEQHILEEVTIRRIHDKLYYYDGRIYRPLSKEKFFLLLRSCLPTKIEKLIPSFYKMEEV